MSIPTPPSITPKQMNLLRIVTAMAWADGQLAKEEVDLMLEKFSRLFATGEQQEALEQELRDYLMQNVPLSESIPKLETLEEKSLVLKLGYEVIASSSRTPDEPKINQYEAQAYRQLVTLLNLPEDLVNQIEQEAQNQLDQPNTMIDKMVESIQSFLGR
jgi:uncharacterized membrane protein YebE (DUF533 family)